jgi:hypothetical protein
MLQSPASAGPDPAARVLPQSAIVSFAWKYDGILLTALRRIFRSRIYEAGTATVINAGLIGHCVIIVIASTRQGSANVPVLQLIDAAI